MWREKIKFMASMIGLICFAGLAVFGAVALSTGAIPAWAQGESSSASVPPYISYQGLLRDDTGDLPTGNYKIDVSIYEGDPDVAGTLKWGPQTHTGVQVNEGRFSLLLDGTDNGFPTDLFTSTDLFVRISVNDAVMRPAQRFTTVPFAFIAENAEIAERAYGLSAPDGAPLDALYVDNSGRVGIGTTSPDEELSVVGRVRGAYDTAENEYTEIGHTGNYGYIKTVGDGNLNFYHDAVNRMSLTDEGDLTVYGDIGWTGHLVNIKTSTYHLNKDTTDTTGPNCRYRIGMVDARNSACFLTKTYNQSNGNTNWACQIYKEDDYWIFEIIAYPWGEDKCDDGNQQRVICDAMCLEW